METDIIIITAMALDIVMAMEMAMPMEVAWCTSTILDPLGNAYLEYYSGDGYGFGDEDSDWYSDGSRVFDYHSTTIYSKTGVGN